MTTRIDPAVKRCLEKKRYRNRRVALSAARDITRKTGIVFRPYKCGVCYWHHLTSLGYKDEKET